VSEATFLDLAELRQRYLKGGLDEDNTAENPFKQFEIWFKQAQEADLLEPNAMSLSTVDAQGQPSLRTVLLKQFDTDGFVFFTIIKVKNQNRLCKIRGWHCCSPGWR